MSTMACDAPAAPRLQAAAAHSTAAPQLSAWRGGGGVDAVEWALPALLVLPELWPAAEAASSLGGITTCVAPAASSSRRTSTCPSLTAACRAAGRSAAARQAVDAQWCSSWPTMTGWLAATAPCRARERLAASRAPRRPELLPAERPLLAASQAPALVDDADAPAQQPSARPACCAGRGGRPGTVGAAVWGAAQNRNRRTAASAPSAAALASSCRSATARAGAAPLSRHAQRRLEPPSALRAPWRSSARSDAGGWRCSTAMMPG
mmetsp:Transcript_22864/g.58273  ORF Transcript_22864/g.58273 Transcript_22864/m.58273 type:complete len:264 (-) Transcript_22864:107-898(-)